MNTTDYLNYPGLSQPITTEQKAKIASVLLESVLEDLCKDYEEYKDEIDQFDETRGVIAFLITKLNIRPR